MNIKKAIVVGGAGFIGSTLTETLLSKGYVVYSIIRQDSPHRNRLDKIKGNLNIIECELNNYISVANQIITGVDVMYYINWAVEEGYRGQYVNLSYIVDAVDFASEVDCKRIVITGSQAEYGVVPSDEIIVEDRCVNPFSDYGAAKVAACYLSRQYANDLGIEWIWGRIFSLIGKYELRTRMLPALYESLIKDEEFRLSSCRQNWDYLDVHDAADALIALAEKGNPGEIYNIANGNYRELREYVGELQRITGSKANVIYGDDPSPFVSLQPSVEKIYKDTGWKAKRSFADSIEDYKYLD